MSVIDDLLAKLPGDVAVRSVLVGAHWMVVCSRYCGLAAGHKRPADTTFVIRHFSIPGISFPGKHIIQGET